MAVLPRQVALCAGKFDLLTHMHANHASFSSSCLSRYANCFKLLQVSKFAYLGHGESLLQLLSRDAAALECMIGSLQGSAVAPLDEVCSPPLRYVSYYYY